MIRVGKYCRFEAGAVMAWIEKQNEAREMIPTPNRSDRTMSQKPKVMASIPQKQAFQRIEMIETAPTSRGKTNLLKYLNGGKLTRSAAIIAKCCDCMGYHIDGRTDCQTAECPLYPFMPYRGKKRG